MRPSKRFRHNAPLQGALAEDGDRESPIFEPHRLENTAPPNDSLLFAVRRTGPSQPVIVPSYDHSALDYSSVNTGFFGNNSPSSLQHGTGNKADGRWCGPGRLSTQGSAPTVQQPYEESQANHQFSQPELGDSHEIDEEPSPQSSPDVYVPVLLEDIETGETVFNAAPLVPGPGEPWDPLLAPHRDRIEAMLKRQARRHTKPRRRPENPSSMNSVSYQPDPSVPPVMHVADKQGRKQATMPGSSSRTAGSTASLGSQVRKRRAGYDNQSSTSNDHTGPYTETGASPARMSEHLHLSVSDPSPIDTSIDGIVEAGSRKKKRKWQEHVFIVNGHLQDGYREKLW